MHSEIEIPGYDIERVLGEGAMAKVYLATQRSLERKVALKVMSAALAADPTFCERFLREGKMQAKLSNPYTVGIFDIGNVGNLYYMAMEYLPNGTLKERMREGMSPEEGIGYLRQVAQALGYAHSKGLVHRDVKPQNIFIRADGTIALGDFGIACPVGVPLRSQNGSFAGTPSYTAPEVLDPEDGSVIDGRSDVWSLGCVLFELMHGGARAFGGRNLAAVLGKIMLGDRDPLDAAANGYSPALCSFVESMLATDVALRPQAAVLRTRAQTSVDCPAGTSRDGARDNGDLAILSPEIASGSTCDGAAMMSCSPPLVVLRVPDGSPSCPPPRRHILPHQTQPLPTDSTVSNPPAVPRIVADAIIVPPITHEEIFASCTDNGGSTCGSALLPLSNL